MPEDDVRMKDYCLVLCGAIPIVINNATLNPLWDFNQVLLPTALEIRTPRIVDSRRTFCFFAGHLNLEDSFTQLKRDKNLETRTDLLPPFGGRGWMA